MSTGVEHRRQQQRGRHRPGVAAALAALHDHRVGTPARDLLGVLGRADRRDHHHARLFQLGDQVRLRRQRERRHLDALADQQVDPVDGVAGVGADVDAERLVRRGLHLGDRGLQFVERHRRRREDAEAACVGGRRHQPGTGHPAHAGLDDRMLDTDQLGQRRAEPTRRRHDRIFLVPQRLRVDHLAKQLQLVGGGQPRLLRLVQPVHLEGGVLANLFRLDAGMQRHAPAWCGRGR